MGIVAIPYERGFKRDKFTCGKASLDSYILRNVTKDVEAGACACFVVTDEENRVIAYYTLSNEAIPLDDAPKELKKKVNYPHIPVSLLGRLAVHSDYSGKGYGRFLIGDSLQRSLDIAKNQIGSMAVVVDPIDEEAENFYANYGFTKLPDSGRMFMTMKKIEQAFNLTKEK